MNPSDADSEHVARAMDDFVQAMDLRTERNDRVARRVTATLRVGVVSFALFGVLLAVMLWAFTDRVRVMIDVLGTMRTEFSQMSDNMSEMRGTLSRLERDMTSFSDVTAEMRVTRETVSAVDGAVQEMAGRTAVMSTDFDRVTAHVAQMNQSFRQLSPSVAGIGANVDQGSGPMKTFNSMFPFSWMLR